MAPDTGVAAILRTENMREETSMKCSVVRSPLKDYTYIYLRDGYDFDDLPTALKQAFGKPEFVINLELTPGRKLAYEDVEQVRRNLAEQGYHLQMPPREDATGLLDLPESPGQPAVGTGQVPGNPRSGAQ